MNSYNSALNKLKRNNISIKNEIVSIKKLLNRVVAKDVISPSNYPLCDNTSLDGYAVNSKETNSLNYKKSKKFKIIKTIAAGDNPNIKNIPKFSAIEVMTGSIIPKPFDTIIPIEQAQLFSNNSKYKYIILKNKLKKNE